MGKVACYLAAMLVQEVRLKESAELEEPVAMPVPVAQVEALLSSPARSVLQLAVSWMPMVASAAL
jgi:hypothetical protein